MTKEDLIKRLGDHEDNFVERKTDGASNGELRQTAVAFANTVSPDRTAVLFIGIHDKTGEVLGVTDPDRTQKKLRDLFEGDCYPPIRYTAEVLPKDGKNVVAVVIPHSHRRPHFAGPSYVRVGSESRKASEQQFEELILSRNDKCRELLRCKNHVVTVRGVGYKLGSGKPLADSSYLESLDCRILDCTAQYVTLQNIDNDHRFSEPLAGVTINFDHNKQRLLLQISHPKA